MPAPPWRKPRKPAAPRRQLSQELIIETGLRILDEEGLDALTMRRVAQELDTGPASLYAHVANKEELIELIYEKVIEEVRLPEDAGAPWQDRLRALAWESRRVLTAHADIARAALANVPTGPNSLRLAEYMFKLLIEAGLTPKAASLAMDRLSLYIAGDTFEGSLHFARQRASGWSVEEYLREYFGQVETYLRQLPPDRFPTIAAHVDDLLEGGDEERFDFGLDLIIAGIEARLRPSR